MIELYDGQPGWRYSWREIESKLTGGELGLVSRQARSEARAVHYKLTTFVVVCDLWSITHDTERLAKALRDAIAPHAQLLKRLSLRLNDYMMKTGLANYVWLRRSSDKPITGSVLYQEPAPFITKEMVLSLPLFDALGVLPKAVTIELRDDDNDSWEKLPTDEEAKAAVENNFAEVFEGGEHRQSSTLM